jgi:hypothetical protein
MVGRQTHAETCAWCRAYLANGARSGGVRHHPAAPLPMRHRPTQPRQLRAYALCGYSSQPLGLRDFLNVRHALVAVDAATGTGSNRERGLRHQERACLASLA